MAQDRSPHLPSLWSCIYNPLHATQERFIHTFTDVLRLRHTASTFPLKRVIIGNYKPPKALYSYPHCAIIYKDP